MNTFAVFLASATLLAPALFGALKDGETAAHSVPKAETPSLGFQQQMPEPFRKFEDGFRPQVQEQVRIERRVIIRIAPSPPSAREEMLSRLPRREMAKRYQEEELDGCVPVESIAGSAPLPENRLLLFMRDRRVLSASLERACSAQAFYSGFYVERNGDGMLCSGRDRLQSRAGASCEVARLNRLVAVRD
ncbi:hypothetical protein GRI75_04875 [Altererythrobacter soli]|uniref:Uncharacterized protein n=1 Tax=Croceibacterium soli TaxID=1739690 RepID=A0A6I4UTZ2_9SPHN|nr:hypothetical protein [Croceibacterium soli]MXP40977.1 hypothetical protein [Croceibacterium soli]